MFHQKSERARDDGRGEAGALSPVYVAASRAIGVGQEASHGTRGGKAVVRPMSRGIPVRWEGAAPIGVVRDGLCVRIRRGDGKGVPAQLRDVVGQVRAQARPRFTFIACGVDEYGFLGIRSVDLQYGVQGLRQVPSIPLQLRTDGAGDDIGIEHSRAIRSIDDVELRVVVSLGTCEFIVEEIAGCGREYCNPPLHGFVCEGVCSLVGPSGSARSV